MSQIRIVSINRERSRFLVCPFVMSWGINRVTDRFFRSLKGPGVTAGDIGKALLDAFAFIERTGPLELSLEEQENCWRHDTKYKTWRAFARNNDFVDVTYYEDDHYCICAYPPRTRDLVGDEVWRGTVPAGASAEELGQAVLDAYAAVDEWKKTHGRRAAPREPVARSAALCDGGEVLLSGPGEGFEERTSAAGEVLLAFEHTGRDGDPVASLYLAEAEWDEGPDGGEAWDEWLERWEEGERARALGLARAVRGGPVHAPLDGAKRLVPDGRAARAPVGRPGRDAVPGRGPARPPRQGRGTLGRASSCGSREPRPSDQANPKRKQTNKPAALRKYAINRKARRRTPPGFRERREKKGIQLSGTLRFEAFCS
ncbi:hypothetical protein D805_0447 [Bifidobacterium thermophilum RBL67]|uniref:Uncharacterized protein n=1 Tax=Bifidobacterium thermophilum RBL67 TaxID=1254439 RepID=M4REW2_9BIFI|nr:hypothetical protein [Bifidobacterium thermophilum]AGH40714.1 hypothetical protein D805_0447 [Bifidobacterium thermophilum RBL67]